MISVNVKSVLYGIQAVLPHFRERNRGHVIAVSSMLARRIPFVPARSAYSAAKAAVTSLMTSLRLELRAAGSPIHVSSVLPGVVARLRQERAAWRRRLACCPTHSRSARSPR